LPQAEGATEGGETPEAALAGEAAKAD